MFGGDRLCRSRIDFSPPRDHPRGLGTVSERGVAGSLRQAIYEYESEGIMERPVFSGTPYAISTCSDIPDAVQLLRVSPTTSTRSDLIVFLKILRLPLVLPPSTDIHLPHLPTLRPLPHLPLLPSPPRDRRPSLRHLLHHSRSRHGPGTPILQDHGTEGRWGDRMVLDVGCDRIEWDADGGA